MSYVQVPGAEHQVAVHLDDLTTPATVSSGHTVEADWAHLHAAALRNRAGIAGVQIDGYFPSESRLNTHHGWDHDAQFVLRLPDDWNGKLVVTGSPGVRRQYASDVIIGDWVVGLGYAYASTDKGNSGPDFHTAGRRPGDAPAEWHRRVTELTIAVRDVVRAHYGTEPSRVYSAGISNGGYLTRWQLENNADLFDGGADCEGALWCADDPPLFASLPVALRQYPAFRDRGDESAHAAMVAAGFPAGSEFLWEFHDQVYWGLTQRIFRTSVDPDSPDADDASYDYASRPAEVRAAVERNSLTGDIKRPLITVHGTLDVLLPITLHADRYADMVRTAGRSSLHRLHRIEGATHVDGLCDMFPDRLTPLVPSFREAFLALESWVERGTVPAAQS